MKSNKLFYSILGLGIIALVAHVTLFTKAEATFQIPKVDICHYDGQSGNFQTLNIAQVAANVHLALHDEDYQGECEEVTPTPTVEPECDQDICPTPTEEATPSATLTPEPTQPASPAPGGDGLSSCPSCTQAPKGEVLGLTGPPATGRAK